MFSFDRFARVATAAVGALVLSTLSVAAAVGPARSVETTPITAQVQSETAAHA